MELGEPGEPGEPSQPGEPGEPGAPRQLGEPGEPGEPGQRRERGEPGELVRCFDFQMCWIPLLLKLFEIYKLEQTDRCKAFTFAIVFRRFEFVEDAIHRDNSTTSARKIATINGTLPVYIYI